MKVMSIKLIKYLLCFSSVVLLTYCLDVRVENADAATVCQSGTKKGKTPISLKLTDKPGCYNIAQAVAGKKLLTSSLPCKTCHAANSTLYPKGPVTKMNSNLRDQGYTLSAGNIKKAFNAHIGEMANSTIKSSDAKAISNYLQSIK